MDHGIIQDICKIHSLSYMYLIWKIHSLLLHYYILALHCIDVPLFVHSTIEWTLGLLLEFFFSIANSAAVTILVYVFRGTFCALLFAVDRGLGLQVMGDAYIGISRHRQMTFLTDFYLHDWLFQILCAQKSQLSF